MAYTDYLDTVQKVYIGYYQRPADPSGLIWWAAKLDAQGGNLNSIIDAFANSAESQSLYGTIDSSNIGTVIDGIYQALFNRTADAAGKAYYVDGFNQGQFTAATIMLNILNGAAGEDKLSVDNKLAAANLFTKTIDPELDGRDFQATYSGDADASAARTFLAGVTWVPTTVPTQSEVTSFIQTNIADASDPIQAPVTGTTYTLTTGSDVINGTSANDTIIGNLGTMSGGADEIHGSGGTDTLSVKLDTAAAPVIDGVETITLISRGANASFDLANVSGVTTLNVEGINNFALSGLANSATVNVQAGYSADVTFVLATNTATAQALTVNLNDASGADVRFTADSGTTAADTLTLNAMTNWAHSGATNFSGVEVLKLQGDGNVELNLAKANHASAAISADAINDLSAIDASGLNGNLTLTLDSKDINIAGGAGNDTFNLTANWNTNDTIVGGAGNDTVNAILTGGYIRPIMSGVENLNLLVNSTAATADFRDVAGVTTVDLLLGTGLVIDRALTAMATINVNSSDSTANNLTVQYGTAAGASDVTLNLGIGSSVLATTNATATGMGIGTITMSGNSGSLTIKTDSTAKYTAAALELKDFTAVTLNATGANLVVDSAVDVYTAQTLNLYAGAGKTLTIGEDLSADGAKNFTIEAGQSATVNIAATASLQYATGVTVTLNAGASATINLSAVLMSGVDTLSINAGASALVTADAIILGQDGATAGSGAVSLNTIDITGAGDVAIGVLRTNTAASYSAISLTVNAGLTSTAASVDLAGVGFSDVGSAATANEQDITFNFSGSGSFVLSAAATDSSNVTWHVNASNVASGSNVVINLANVNDTGSVASAVFGAASGSYVGVDGVDNIELGAGAMTVNGALGNDTITFNSSVNYVEMSVDTVAGKDTVLGAGSGDILLFSAANTATANSYLTAAWQTGTATNTAQILTASFSAMVTAAGLTAVQQLAIFTANGDTIIQVLGGTAVVDIASSGPASGTDDYVTIVLSNKDFTAITAAFQLNTTGSGLSITLL